MLGQNLVAAMDRFGFEEGMTSVLQVLVERSVESRKDLRLLTSIKSS